MLMTSYKNVVKEIPEFDLTIDKRNIVLMETKLETTLDWKGSAGIILKEEDENEFTLSVLRKGVTVFEGTFMSEEEANSIMYEKIEHLRQIVELECSFIM